MEPTSEERQAQVRALLFLNLEQWIEHPHDTPHYKMMVRSCKLKYGECFVKEVLKALTKKHVEIYAQRVEELWTW